MPSSLKRGYSKDFKPHGGSGKRYLLDQIPAGLWARVREKAKREGVSLRALILKLLTEWVNEP
jgi:predicted HicB family RNase H-like nuclease